MTKPSLELDKIWARLDTIIKQKINKYILKLLIPLYLVLLSGSVSFPYFVPQVFIQFHALKKIIGNLKHILLFSASTDLTDLFNIRLF